MSTPSAYINFSDPELLSLLSRDDRAAFDTLYIRYSQEMYRSAFGLLRNREGAMDIVQDIFCWLWEKREDLQVASMPAYLRAAVRFKVANLIRSGKIRDSFFDELARVPAAYKAGPGELAEVNELRGILSQAIENLPIKSREVFRLSREEGLSNQQIAERLGISVKTVEARMTIALREIRAAVEPCIIAFLLGAAIASSS